MTDHILEELLEAPHSGCNPDDWAKVNKNLRILAYETIEYCKVHNLPLIFNSIIRPMIPGVSKTDIHAKGRAFDICGKDWTKEQCLEFEKYFNSMYANSIGAVGKETGKKIAALYESPQHNGRGTGPHLHLQVRP